MNLLLTGAYQYTDSQIKQLESLGYAVTFVQDERVPLLEQAINVSEIEAIVCNGLFLYNDIFNFKRLKFIQLTSAGFDRVPIDYIKEHGIQLFNAKGVYSIPMAEWAVLKVLEIYKQSRCFYKSQEEKQWVKNRDLLELMGKTAAIVGFGSVGSEIAKRLKSFGVHVIGVGRRQVESEYVDEVILTANIEAALEKSDIVILTLPLTDQTHHLLNKDRLTTMKDNCVLINVSRGGLIDEDALIEALDSGKFFGVASDVFEQEPLPESSQLWEFENVIITPHNSFMSDRVNDRLFEMQVENLEQHIRISDDEN